MVSSSEDRKCQPYTLPTSRVAIANNNIFRIGAALISIGCPVAVYALTFFCNDISGCPAPSLLSPSKLFTPPAFTTQTGWEHATEVLAQEVGWPGWSGLVTVKSMLGSLAWYAFSLFLYAALPAQELEGTELRTGGRLKYRFNGMDNQARVRVTRNAAADRFQPSRPP